MNLPPKTTATAYCKDNHLCVVGMHHSKVGPIPFATSVRIGGEVEDGQVDLTKELSPLVKRAMGKVQHPIASQIENDTMRLTAEDLVIRTRAGEQVAAAILMGVGKNAKQGVLRAQRALKYVEEAIQSIPLRPLSVVPALRREHRAKENFARVIVGADEPEKYAQLSISLLPLTGIRGVVILANGPDLIKTGRARAIAQGFDDAIAKHAFCLARKHCTQVNANERASLPPKIQRAMRIGHSFGIAQKIQAVRIPNSRISDFDAAVGWELGE